jgi:hypothetical protein
LWIDKYQATLLSGGPSRSGSPQKWRMGSTQAKLFEWHRISTELDSVRSLSAKATLAGDGEAEIARLQTLIDSLEERSRTLLAEIDLLRSTESKQLQG